MYALNLGTGGRILSATFEEYATADMPKVDLLPTQESTAHGSDTEQVIGEGGDITDYLYVDGKYTYDPLPKPEVTEPEPTPTTAYVSYDELAKAIQEGVNSYNGQ